MKKLSLTSIVLALFVTFMFCACGGGGVGKGKTPADISLKLWEHIQKGNYEKAAEFWFDNADFGDKAPSESEKKETIAVISAKYQESMAEQPKITKVQLNKEEINEEYGTAKVSVLLVYEDGNEEVETTKFKKVDGVWKLDASAK